MNDTMISRKKHEKEHVRQHWPVDPHWDITHRISNTLRGESWLCLALTWVQATFSQVRARPNAVPHP
eukprot:658901-Pelagomonas_calceolata.AAC.3